MQKSTKYFVAAIAAVALFAGGYTYFGSNVDTTANTTNAAKATITAPNSNYIENAQPAVQTGPTNTVPAPASGEVEADANATK